MKKIIVVVVSIVSFFCAQAQKEERPVLMKYVYSYEDALQKARDEHKLIFFNCFADWAIPCHSMNAVVFSDPEFTDFMNKNFVNLFVEMVNTEEGKALAQQYQVKTYAQYLILNSDGEVVHRIVGGSKPQEFLKQVQQGMNPETCLKGIVERYNKGDRDVNFLRSYLQTMADADMNKEYEEAVKIFLSSIKKEELPKAENWFVVARAINDPSDEMFSFLLEHKAEFAKYNALHLVNSRLSSVAIMDFYKLATGEATYSPEEFVKYDSILKKMDLPSSDQIFVVRDMAQLRGEKKYDQVLDVLEKGASRLEQRVLTPALEMSLSKIRDYTPEQKKRVVEYLKKRQEKTEGSLHKNYQHSIDEVLNFKGILFANTSFENTLADARAQGRPVFLDCYTTWCGPCRMMSDKVFVQDKVGEFFNKNLISLKIDMEKGEGKELLKRYQVKAYPTMLLLDGDGNLLHRIVGAMDAMTLLEKVNRGMNPATSYRETKKKYDAGDRSVETVPAYLMAMEDAGELKDGEEKIRTYLQGLSVKDRCERMPWLLFVTTVKDCQDPLFRELVGKRSSYDKLLGEDVVYKYLERIYFPALAGDLEKQLPQDVYASIGKDLKKAGIAKKSLLGYLYQLVDLYHQKDYKAIMALYKSDIMNIKEQKDRLNLDILLDNLMRNAPQELRRETLVYAKANLERADPRAKNGYMSLVRNLERSVNE